MRRVLRRAPTNHIKGTCKCAQRCHCFSQRIRPHAWERNGYAAAEKGWQLRVANADTGPYEKKPWKRQTCTGATPALKNAL